ncbi:hypothetical protein NS228_00040 [Methylobacterium indicum]|nr:hypothetical protein NS229_06765 [Methylobacterium indicum]KTS43088.1 hypothetical protein NS228_00040 [Methylobacterium indicum]KTS54534.1 hypothetical protein NS230_01520 [Methylobacterium indicum]
MSRRRRPVSGRSSNRLPATVARRFGREGPRFSIGQDRVTRARRRRAGSIAAVVGSEGASTGASNTSRRSTRAAERSLSSGVSPGTGTKVPLDCSPAIVSATRRGSLAVSRR